MTLPSWPEMLRVFGRIGLLSFGGPAAQIGVMHRELVDERPWLSERQFLNALGFCMLLPGPEAMQLATYAGWRLRGTAGGLLAGMLFVLPGALVIGVLALLYARYGTMPQTEALLLGIKATVIVIVIEALRRLMRKALTGPAMVAVALLSFAAIFLFDVPFPLLILVAALFGATRAAPAATPQPLPTGTFRPGVIALWALLWLAPLPLLALGGQTLLFELSAFFAKLAVVTFGGAYAVLAYMAQEVVSARGWLDPLQMVDALGLAETTPGPLILVTQFVGMLTGFAAGGTGLALAAGALTLWMTFVPVLPVDLRRCALCRTPADAAAPAIRAVGNHRSGRRRDTQPLGLVRAACRFCTGPAARLRTRHPRGPGPGEPAPRGADPDRARSIRDARPAPRSAGHAAAHGIGGLGHFTALTQRSEVQDRRG